MWQVTRRRGVPLKFINGFYHICELLVSVCKILSMPVHLQGLTCSKRSVTPKKLRTPQVHLGTTETQTSEQEGCDQEESSRPGGLSNPQRTTLPLHLQTGKVISLLTNVRRDNMVINFLKT